MFEVLPLSLDPRHLDQLFALYHRSFPGSKLRPEASLRRAIATPSYRVLTTIEQGNVSAFAILFAPPAEPFALLEYLAVAPADRSRGLGAALFAAATLAVADRYLLVETETATDDPLTVRRHAFYRRQGCRRVEGLRYQLPLPGTPPPMDLLIRPVLPVPIRRDDLTAWLRRIYVEVYDCAAVDPRITEMTEFLRDPIVLSERASLRHEYTPPGRG